MRRALISILILGVAGCASFSARKPAVYFVFFNQGSTALTPDARTIVDSAARTIKAAHPKTVAIGSGDAGGDNLALAEPRFATIRNALVADGIDDKLLARSNLPETGAMLGPTGQTRVEIRLVMDN